MQAETEGNGYVASMAHNESPIKTNGLDGHNMPETQNLTVQESHLANQHTLVQMQQEGNLVQLSGQQNMSHLGDQHQHMHQMSASEITANSLSGPQGLLQVQNPSSVHDIAAPEVRTHIRTQAEEVLLHSTFTQTVPYPDDEKKVSNCQGLLFELELFPHYLFYEFEVVLLVVFALVTYLL